MQEVAIDHPNKAQKVDLGRLALSHLAEVNSEVQELKNLLIGQECVELTMSTRKNAKVSATIRYPNCRFLPKDVQIPQEISLQVHSRIKGASKAIRTYVNEYEREYLRGERIKACASRIGTKVMQGVKVVVRPKQCNILPVGEALRI